MDHAKSNVVVVERPALLERERRFAVAYFEVAMELGTDIGAALPAYRRAFPMAVVDDSSAGTLAQKLIRSENVKALVTQLRSESASRAAAPPEHIIAQIERVAFANPLDFGRVDVNGSYEVDLTNVTHAQMVAVKEIKVTEREAPDGTITRVTVLKLHSNLDALDKLSKIHGLYHDPATNLTPSEVMRVIQTMRRRLGMVSESDAA